MDSIPRVRGYWADCFTHAEKRVTREQLFDLGVAGDAKARRDRHQPFGH